MQVALRYRVLTVTFRLHAGHWKLGHTPKNFVLSQVVIFAQMCLFTFTRTAPGLFESFGFVNEQPVFISIVLFQLLQGPIDEVSQFTRSWAHTLSELQTKAHRNAILRTEHARQNSEESYLRLLPSLCPLGWWKSKALWLFGNTRPAVV